MGHTIAMLLASAFLSVAAPFVPGGAATAMPEAESSRPTSEAVTEHFFRPATSGDGTTEQITFAPPGDVAGMK